jgi:hypothetical protein
VIDAQEYQAVSNELVGQGYRLVFVSAFGSGNAAKYCAICRKNDGPDWEASHGQTADDFQATMDDRRHRGSKLGIWSHSKDDNRVDTLLGKRYPARSRTDPHVQAKRSRGQQ